MRLRTVKCPKCGGSIRFEPGVESTQCMQCGETIPLAEALRLQEESARYFPNPTPLRLGMKAMFQGVEYELIGRIVLSMTEEGEKYTWDEFELVSAEGDCIFVEYDEGQWKLMRTFVPKNPISLPTEPGGASSLEALSSWGSVRLPGQRQLTVGSSIQLQDTPAKITQISVATIEFVQGELTWTASVGDSVHYLDAQSMRGELYAVEWSPDEIEFYVGRYLTDREVLVAFALHGQLHALENLEKKRKAQAVFATACLALAMLSFLAWAVSLRSGGLVSRHEVPIGSVIDENGFLAGPLTLDPGGRVHRLRIHGSMTQASAWFAAVLETPDGAELIGTQHDFWDESGTDSDGPWHEWDLNAQTDFVVKQPGNYYVRLYAERDISPMGSFGNAGYEMHSRVIYPTYFLTYGIVAAMIGVLFLCLAYQKNLGKMAQQMAESSDDDDDD